MNARHATVVVLLAVLALVVSGLSATAATLQAHGYWYRAQTGLLGENMPPPPGVPEDGLAVSAGFEGTTEVSAVRYQLDEDETDPVLTLEVAEENGGDIALIDACPAQGRWEPAHAGRWDDRPTCEEDAPRAPGARSEDGATWIWELEELVGEDGLLDVVLEPGSLEGQGEQAPTSSSFRVTFAPPDDASLRTTTDAGATGDFEPPPVEEGVAVPETADAPETGSAPPPAAESGGFSGAPGTDVGSGGEQPQGEPPPVAADPADPAAQPEGQAVDGVGATGGLPTDQILALLALVAAGLYAVDVRHRAARPPRRLGPLAGDGDDAADADDGAGGDRVEEPAPLV